MEDKLQKEVCNTLIRIQEKLVFCGSVYITQIEKQIDNQIHNITTATSSNKEIPQIVVIAKQSKDFTSEEYMNEVRDNTRRIIANYNLRKATTEELPEVIAKITKDIKEMHI